MISVFQYSAFVFDPRANRLLRSRSADYSKTSHYQVVILLKFYFTEFFRFICAECSSTVDLILPMAAVKQGSSAN